MRWGSLASSFVCLACNSAASGVASFETDFPLLPSRFEGTAAILPQPSGELKLVLTDVSAPPNEVCEVARRAVSGALADEFVAVVTLPNGASSGGLFNSLTSSFEILDATCSVTPGMSGLSQASTVSIDTSFKGLARLAYTNTTFVVSIEAQLCDELVDASFAQCESVPACVDGGPEVCRNGP